MRVEHFFLLPGLAWLRLSFCGLFIIMSPQAIVYAEKNKAEPTLAEGQTPRENAWILGTTWRRLNLTAANDYELKTWSPSLDIGRGWVRKNWWNSVEVSLTLGPNGKRLAESPPLDYTGNSLKARIGHTWPGHQLRSTHGDWGGEFGIEYSEWNARSYRNQRLGEDQSTTNWLIRSRWIFLQPALFYSLWEAPRPRGNKPEWIQTRLEGIILSLGMSIPIQSQLQARFQKNNIPQTTTSRWQGSIAFLSISTWLGI